MATAGEIKNALRLQEKDRTRRRTDAVMAVVAAAERAASGQEMASRRKAQLREQYELALAAEDARVAQLEAAAGQAVVAATGGELEKLGCAFRENELRDLTGLPVAEFRRWVRAARQAGDGSAGDDAGGEPSAPGRPVASRDAVAGAA